MKTDIHIFSPGTQTSAQGVTREFTPTDLKQVANSYNADLHEAPIRIGHEDSDKVPSWGWVKQVKMKGDDLYAEVEFSPLMEDYVKNGLYKKVSASFYAPESKINPDPGSWSLRHVAMLGAQPPAVKGLKGFAYSEESDGDGVLDFAVEMKLTPDQVFDEELGPTLREEQSPLEQLKDKLEEARTEMAQEEKRKEDLGQAEEELDQKVDEAIGDTEDDFAEEMKKKQPKVKQGAEGSEEEEEEGEDAVDNGELPPALKANAEKKKKEAADKEEDTSDNKEKMDPVGKEDDDIDNDGDSDSTDGYLKNRRKAIKAAIKEKTKNFSEEDTADHAGCDSKKKKNYKEDEGEDYAGDCGSSKKRNYKEDEAKHNEVSVPDGVDSAQWEAGFKDAVDKFYAAVQVGADEVVHQEAEDQTADYLAGIEAGFEFAQARLNRIGSDNVGSNSHNDKCCDTDEESDGEGPVSSKVKKNKKHGANETDSESGNNFGETVKKGKDGLKNTDKNEMAEDEDEAKHADPNSGIEDDRMKTGKTKESDASNRKKKGVADKGSGPMMRDTDYDEKGTDGGAQEKDRASKGTGSVPKQDGGKSKDVQAVKETTYKSLGNGGGGGKQIKSPAVRVMKFSEAQFSELSERLAELEAANSRLLQEKMEAERQAHRLQLEDFTESLYATGRLTPAVCDQEELVDYMEGLENGTLEFSEGESPATKLMELLAALPAQVSFSEVAPHNEDELPEESLDPHSLALRMVKEQGMDYTEALKQTLFTAE